MSVVLNDTETVNAALMDTGFYKDVLSCKCKAAATDVLANGNTEQVQVATGTIINRRNQKEKPHSK